MAMTGEHGAGWLRRWVGYVLGTDIAYEPDAAEAEYYRIICERGFGAVSILPDAETSQAARGSYMTRR